MEHIANTFFLTKKVGSPCESFSNVSGNARQMPRTRSICFSPLSGFGSFAIRFISTAFSSSSAELLPGDSLQQRQLEISASGVVLWFLVEIRTYLLSNDSPLSLPLYIHMTIATFLINFLTSIFESPFGTTGDNCGVSINPYAHIFSSERADPNEIRIRRAGRVLYFGRLVSDFSTTARHND